MTRAVEALILAIAIAAAAPSPAAQAPQTVQDEYAVYDLGEFNSGEFRTVYDVAVTTPGATEFRDAIGGGLTPVDGRDDGVVDLMTGERLKFEVEGRALRIHLARPVPPELLNANEAATIKGSARP